jgi:hypothetical protein
MTTAEAWYYFWTAAFLVSGSSFALIAVVVMVRGIEDLRALIDVLKRAGHEEGGG